jgi:hypothetical protein
MQTSVALRLHEEIEVQLPGAGMVEAEVIRSDNGLFGCRFKRPVSQAVVSAALLKSAPPAAVDPAASATIRAAAAELKHLSARLDQLKSVVDHAAETPAAPSFEAAKWFDPDADDLSEKLPLATRLRIILALSVGSWLVILTLVWMLI